MAYTNRLSKRYLEELASDTRKLYEQSFEALLRYLDANSPMHERIGYSISLKQDAFRLGQAPQLHFHASAFSEVVKQPVSGQYKLKNVFWGLFGINGALPHHLTEYAIERQYRHRDNTLSEFCDIFHHRFLSLYYRAWADAQPTVSQDHAQTGESGQGAKCDAFGQRVAVFAGSQGQTSGHSQISSGDQQFEQYLAGLLSSKNRGAGVLQQALSSLLKKPVEIREFEGCWFDLPKCEYSHLGGANARLGQDAVIGKSSFQRSFNFSIVIGPLSYHDYISMVGDKQQFRLVRQVTSKIVGSEFSYSIQLKLKAQQKTSARLGHSALGINSWSKQSEQLSDTPHIAYRQDYSNHYDQGIPHG